MYYCDDEIDRLICEDMPYFDLTTTLLKINNTALINFISRKDTIVSGTYLVKKLANKLNLKVEYSFKDGDFIKSGKSFFTAKGESQNILTLWKVAQNIFEYACGVATYTNDMVKIAKEVNPNIEILTTRKIIPFTKKIAIQAIMDGGAYPHRITTGETILLFENYINLYGGWDKFMNEFKTLKSKSVEKKWVVEAKDIKMAKKFIDIGVDILQLDKVDIDTTKQIVSMAKNNMVKVITAGGVNINNIQEYAKTGTNAIITTSPYYAKSGDIKVLIEKG